MFTNSIMKTRHLLKYICLAVVTLWFFSCKKDQQATNEKLQVISIAIGSQNLDLATGASNTGFPVDQPIEITFNSAVDISSVNSGISLSLNGTEVPLNLSFSMENKTVTVTPVSNLQNNQTYELTISSSVKGEGGETFDGLTTNFTTIPATLEILSATVSGKDLLSTGYVTDVDRNFPAVIKMDRAIDPGTLSSSSVVVFKAGATAQLSYTLTDSGKTINLLALSPLVHFEKYTLTITNQLKAADGAVFNGFTKDFYTAIDSTPKFPVVSDEDLLTLVEQQTFKYFWDFGHPVSGMARERNNSGDVVTTGGSGFGAMAILVGIHRNFISRQEGVDRLEKMVDFLTTADRFHGAWPHWMNGATGAVIPFSVNDNGADLVETSFLMEGLLAVRQFLDPLNAQENGLIAKINDLWNTVEWDWFTQAGQDVLYWHWSPDKGWIMNVQIKGYDEALITYVLAAASPTHTIDADVYHNGWASNGTIVNGNSYYGFPLPVGPAYGGPLFFAHYSFLGFDPHNLQDQYANYWTQNVNHTEINRAYCIDNPKNYVGYSEKCWGLTASDNQAGYSAHSPTNDLGVIAPTAALSSFPYTLDYSMDALKFFYYTIGDKLWGPYGFYDAFNPSAGWYANSDLAIDEGPIIVMIENYRSGLLWDLFMSSPEIDVAMNKLGFTN
jgi:hypothetical protein